MDIRIPLFRDTNTPEFRGEAAVLPPPPGEIHETNRVRFLLSAQGVVTTSCHVMSCHALSVAFGVECVALQYMVCFSASDAQQQCRKVTVVEQLCVEWAVQWRQKRR